VPNDTSGGIVNRQPLEEGKPEPERGSPSQGRVWLSFEVANNNSQLIDNKAPAFDEGEESFVID